MWWKNHVRKYIYIFYTHVKDARIESWRKRKEKEKVILNYKAKWNIIEVILKLEISYIVQKMIVNSEQIRFHRI